MNSFLDRVSDRLNRGVEVSLFGLGLAILHYVFLRLSDFGFWEVFSRAGNPPGMKK